MSDGKEDYPDPPKVVSIKTIGNSVNDINDVRITVEYPRTENLKTLEHTIYYGVSNGVASLTDAMGEGTFTDKFASILVAQTEVEKLNGVTRAKDIPEQLASVTEYVARCKGISIPNK